MATINSAPHRSSLIPAWYPILHATAGEQHRHAAHVGELAALREVQRRALGAQLVVEVVDPSVADLADVAVLWLERLAKRWVVGIVGDVGLLEVVRGEHVGRVEHRSAPQCADAGVGQRRLVTPHPLGAALLLEQLGAPAPDLGIREEHVPRRIEEAGLLLRGELRQHLGGRDDVTEDAHRVEQPPADVTETFLAQFLVR